MSERSHHGATSRSINCEMLLPTDVYVSLFVAFEHPPDERRPLGVSQPVCVSHVTCITWHLHQTQVTAAFRVTVAIINVGSESVEQLTSPPPSQKISLLKKQNPHNIQSLFVLGCH